MSSPNQEKSEVTFKLHTHPTKEAQMGYYLLDNPPARRQFWPSRINGLSGGVVIHTTEGSGGFNSAENTAGFISRRQDSGSYHVIVDSEAEAAVLLMPDDHVAFGVAAPGYNSRCWMIAIAAPSAALNADSPYTIIEIDNMAREIVNFWVRNGFDPVTSAQFIGEGVKDRPGLAHHGDVQPADRSDAWSRREDRWVFDSLLLQHIAKHAGGATPAPLPPQQPTTPTPIPPKSIWGPGSSGDKVREIQKIVGVSQDGVYGPKTQAAVAQWQSNIRISADGIWGPATEQATHDLFVFLSNLPAVEQTVPDSAFFAALNEATKQVLRRGSTGGAVKILQTGLNGRGYPLVGDGVFGSGTDAAVRRFQSDRGLMVDGIVGPQTWVALLS
jgi:peptidoglycan hydrolase-like protein with peptidoglycan-binding domain